MVSFFTSPMRTVSFFTLVPGWGAVMRMVSFLPSFGAAPGFGGWVMRRVAFLEMLGSLGAEGGVGSSTIISQFLSHWHFVVSTPGFVGKQKKLNISISKNTVPQKSEIFSLLVFSLFFSLRR